MGGFKQLFDKTCRLITRPLEQDPVGFTLFFLLSSGVQIVDRFGEGFKYGLYIFTFAFLQFYAFFFFFSIYSRAYKFLKPFLAVFLILYFAIDLFCFQKFNCTISPDITSIVFATNYQEAKEFLSVYWAFKDYLVLFGIVFLSVITYCFSLRIRLCFSRSIRLFFISVLIILTFAIVRYKVIASVYWEGLWKFEFNELVDLSLHYTHPVVDYSEESLPNRIVVIIGESFTSSHSSLYDYPIETNPRLSSLKDDSLLFVFSNVESPSTHTIPAFKHILNTFLLSSPDDVAWYESTTIIELLNVMGYQTHWVSNQAKSGMFDNVASSFAKICNTMDFVLDPNKDENYDDNLLTFEPPQLGRHAFFYHMMGQHGAYYRRYPEMFDRFKDSLYKAFPLHQVEPRRTYDNATLYNDYICSEIIGKYQQDDALVFYFPDHGQDFYAVDDEYYGHGRAGLNASINASKQIPFLVYLSPLCKEKHPDLLSGVLSEKDNYLCTDAFTFLVLRLLNVNCSTDV